MNKLIIKQNIFEHNNIIRKFPGGGGMVTGRVEPFADFFISKV